MNKQIFFESIRTSNWLTTNLNPKQTCFQTRSFPTCAAKIIFKDVSNCFNELASRCYKKF